MQIIGFDAVVMGHGVAHGVDPLEIIRVHLMLVAGALHAFGPQIGPQRLQHRIEHRQERHAQFPTTGFQLVPQFAPHKGKHDNAGFSCNRPQHNFQLLFAAHHGMGVFVCIKALKLGERCRRDSTEGFTSGVRNQMQVELGHGLLMP